MKQSFWVLFFVLFFLSRFIHADSFGQVIITGFQGQYSSDPSVQQIKHAIQTGKIGGVLLFGHNIVDRDQLKALIQFLTDGSPTIIAIDHEGGRVNRLNHPSFGLTTPSARAFCLMRLDSQYDHADRTARILADLGINLNFGGVVDIQPLEYESSVCKDNRCYATNASAITQCVRVRLKAHQRYGRLYALKHFPGHGSATVDSHLDLPNISTQHSSHDYGPFYDLSGAPNAVVMVGHLMVDAIDANHPASLSSHHIQTLRNTIGFDGIIVTDDLNMGALKHISTDPIVLAKTALLAGHTMVVFGQLSMTHIDQINRELHTLSRESPLIRRMLRHNIRLIHRTLSHGS